MGTKLQIDQFFFNVIRSLLSTGCDLVEFFLSQTDVDWRPSAETQLGNFSRGCKRTIDNCSLYDKEFRLMPTWATTQEMMQRTLQDELGFEN
jgi:hypothetical protein